MTREEKINWLENASTEELIKQYRSAICMDCRAEGIRAMIECEEDVKLAEAELIKRLSR